MPSPIRQINVDRVLDVDKLDTHIAFYTLPHGLSDTVI